MQAKYRFECPLDGYYYFHWVDKQGNCKSETLKLKKGDMYSFPEDLDDEKNFGAQLEVGI